MMLFKSLRQLPLWVMPALAVVFLSLSPASGAAEPEFIKWDTQKNSVTADIHSWTLDQLLKRISMATGWKVFIEPGTEHTVSAKFEGRTPQKAMDVLLGDLSRVLLPQEKGPPHFLVFRTNRQNATQEIQAQNRQLAERIPNELIVTLKPGADIEKIAAELGAKVVGKIDGQNAYRLQFEDAEAAETAREKLATNENVVSVEDNYQVHRNLPMQAAAESSSLNLRPGPSGCPNGIVVALIDTALQPLSTGIGDFLLDPIAVAGESATPGNIPLHGDVMSQAILKGLQASLQGGGTTDVKIQPYDVYGAKDVTSTFAVADALYQAWQSGTKIVNLSLGSEADSPLLRTIVQSAGKDGVLMFAAAGNEPVDTPTYPAAYPEVIAVTAGDPQGNISPFANYGNFVEVVGPPAARIQFNGQAWTSYGTSVSSATVAGIAAGMMQMDCQNASAVAAQIRQSLAVH